MRKKRITINKLTIKVFLPVLFLYLFSSAFTIYGYEENQDTDVYQNEMIDEPEEEGESGGSDLEVWEEDSQEEEGVEEDSDEDVDIEDQNNEEPDEDNETDGEEELNDDHGDSQEDNIDSEETEEELQDQEAEEEQEPKMVLETQPREAGLGNWTNYNGIIFGDAHIYDTTFGGGLAVGGRMNVYRNFTVGATYTSQYDPTLHIGEYKNQEQLPALLLGGKELQIAGTVQNPSVYGGAITMSPEMLELNNSLENGFIPGNDSEYQFMDQQELDNWFRHQYNVVTNTSKYLSLGNDITLELEEFSDGSYINYGPQHFQNQFFEMNGEVYQNALLVTVRTGSEVNFGQWWPKLSRINVDVNWAKEYDLVVFNFPEAINVTMNSSAFLYQNTTQWSTTVDAWVGEEGMQERLALSEKVVYNFANARSVEASYAFIQGTILAPDATFTATGLGNDGHIYGHIIAKNFIVQNNFTLHAFHMTDQVYDFVNEYFPDTNNTGRVELRQYLFFSDQITNIPLPGGEYVLLDTEGNFYDGNGSFTGSGDAAKVYQMPDSGNTTIDKLPFGSYTLRNIRGPDGFIRNETEPEDQLTYYETDILLAEEQSVAEVIRYMEPIETDLYLRKTDSITGQGIEGAVFAIEREADGYSDAMLGKRYISGADGSFVSYNIPIGIYRLVELEVPQGYTLLEHGEFRFEVYWDDEQQQLAARSVDGIYLGGTKDDPVVIENLAGSAENLLTVIKYAEGMWGTPYILQGAELDLYRNTQAGWSKVTQNAAGEPVEIVIGEQGYYRIQNLESGQYRLTETKAPEGYQLDNPLKDDENAEIFPAGYAHEFILSDEKTSETAYLLNSPWNTAITVQTKGILGEDSAVLPGIAFRLEHLLQDGATWEQIFYRRTTDREGQLYIEGLAAGKYRLSQLNAAAGYWPLDPGVITFNLSFGENNQPVIEAVYNSEIIGADTVPVSIAAQEEITLTVLNEAKTRALAIYKIDADYSVERDENGQDVFRVQYLEGAGFRLRRRVNTRSEWEDYGGVFSSDFLYDDAGEPVRDISGNHMAKAVLEQGLMYGEYQLAEVQVPEGYTISASAEIIFGDGQRGKQIHLFTITEPMTEVGLATEYLAEDYAAVHDTELIIQKVDSINNDQPLEGAEASLYFCGKDHVHDQNAAEDSCWSEQAPLVESSDKNGFIRFTGLVSGTWLLQESKAPPGYRLPAARWLLEADTANDSITLTSADEMQSGILIEADQDSEAAYLLLNQKKFLLPFTGGSGWQSFITGGVILLGTAFAVFIITNRKKEKQKNEMEK